MQISPISAWVISEYLFPASPTFIIEKLLYLLSQGLCKSSCCSWWSMSPCCMIVSLPNNRKGRESLWPMWKHWSKRCVKDGVLWPFWGIFRKTSHDYLIYQSNSNKYYLKGYRNVWRWAILWRLYVPCLMTIVENEIVKSDILLNSK